MSWAENRGLGPQLGLQLKRLGIPVPEKVATEDLRAEGSSHNRTGTSHNFPSPVPTTELESPLPSRKRRLSETQPLAE